MATKKEMAVVDAEVEPVSGSVVVQQEQFEPENPYLPMINKVLETGHGIDQVEKLMDLQIKWEENEAKKAFNIAFARFKAETIVIYKDKKVGYKNKDGSFTGYSHATLGNIIDTVTPFLSRHGLTHNWSIDQEGQSSTVTCHLTHNRGHSFSVTMSAGKDSSGKKNDIQQTASTVTYLQRYTFLAATGLAAKDQDDDGERSEDDTEYITESQVCDLEALVEQAKANMKGFLAWLKVDDLARVPVDRFDAAVAKLEQKIKGGK